MDIYTTDAEYRGKVFDLVINLEKGRIETITTEPLRAKTKLEAKKIITEKSIPYRNVRAAKDILLVGKTPTEPSFQDRAILRASDATNSFLFLSALKRF
jgi:sporulation protein YlmC with PRC-barrel domain